MASDGQQRLMLVLAVQVHQPVADLLQLRHRRRAAHDAAGRLAACRHLAREEEPAVLDLEAHLLHQPQQVRRTADVEDRVQDRPIRAAAHHLGPGASAQDQVQGVYNDGLARAGFACQYIEARLELQVQAVNNGEVADGQGL